jgi:hypothetical protein
MRRIVPAILLIAVLAIAGGLIANTAYEAGVNVAVTTASGAPGTVVAPVVPYGYGYGYGLHPFGFGFGFGLFGFLATLFFLFIVFALLRAIFFGGRHRGGWGPGGWGGPGGPGGHGYTRWENRAHETFDEWHGQAHGTANGTPPASGGPAPTPPTGPA